MLLVVKRSILQTSLSLLKERKCLKALRTIQSQLNESETWQSESLPQLMLFKLTAQVHLRMYHRAQVTLSNLISLSQSNPLQVQMLQFYLFTLTDSKKATQFVPALSDAPRGSLAKVVFAHSLKSIIQQDAEGQAQCTADLLNLKRGQINPFYSDLALKNLLIRYRFAKNQGQAAEGLKKSMQLKQVTKQQLSKLGWKGLLQQIAPIQLDRDSLIAVGSQELRKIEKLVYQQLLFEISSSKVDKQLVQLIDLLKENPAKKYFKLGASGDYPQKIEQPDLPQSDPWFDYFQLRWRRTVLPKLGVKEEQSFNLEYRARLEDKGVALLQWYYTDVESYFGLDNMQ